MKVFPRVLELSRGEKRCDFFIENSSSVNDTLLFKIRRTEPKVVDFHPKAGEIPPGATMNINVVITDPEAYSGRVIVKFVAIKTRKLCPKFSDSWDIGLSRGMAKKIVEVRNMDLFSPSILSSGRNDREVSNAQPASPPKNASVAVGEVSEPLSPRRTDTTPRRTVEKSVNSSKDGVGRAEDFYNTVKEMNDAIKQDLARKQNTSPRAIDKKIFGERDTTATGIVDDLASIDTLPMSPHFAPVGKDTYALTPSSADKTAIHGARREEPTSPTRPLDAISEMVSSGKPPVSSPSSTRRERTDSGYSVHSAHRVETSSPLVALTVDPGALPPHPDPPLCASPVGDVRAYRRHSPVSKGGIIPGVSGPVSTFVPPAAERPAVRPIGIAISIPSTTEDGDGGDDYSDEFDSVFEEDRNEYTKHYSKAHDLVVDPVSMGRYPEPKTDISRLANASSDTEDDIGLESNRENKRFVDLESIPSEYNLSDDESLKHEEMAREVDKYRALESTALSCSEWRYVGDNSSRSESFSELVKSATTPVLSKGGAKLDSHKISAIIQELSAAHLPFSELPIHDTNAADGEPPSVLQVEVSGDAVTDEVARMALRLRTAEIFYAGDMVTSIKIDNSSQFSSLWALDELFGDNNTSGRSGDVMLSRSAVKKHELANAGRMVKAGSRREDKNGPVAAGGIGSAFEDMLSTGLMQLKVTHCRSVHSLPSSLLSNLSSLIHLDLSHNKIREIQGDLGLILPYLKRLNLSHNLLKSLDKLQGLPSLVALDASSNYIQTLHHGPHMLLPLAGHLLSLNLLENPICSLPSYAGETVSLLPNLICFDMRYTKVFSARSFPRGIPSTPALPANSDQNRIISVPKMNQGHGGSEGGHNFVVIKKTAVASSPGYSEKHSPSKNPRKKRSPGGAVREYRKKCSGSPELIPIYPTFGAFKASPGVLVQNSSKGYGQPHQKKAQFRDDDQSVDSINSVNSSDDGNAQMRRAMRAFKAQEQMKNSKVRNSDRDCAAPRQRPQKLRVNPTTREVYADRPTSQKRTAPSSSAQTLLSNIATSGRGKPKRRQQQPNHSVQQGDSDNSVDTDMREPVDHDDESVQSGSDMSELSGHWDGKENQIDNRETTQRWGEKSRDSEPEVHPVAAGFSSESDISSIRRGGEAPHSAQPAGNSRAVSEPRHRSSQPSGMLFDNRGRQNTSVSGNADGASRSRSAPKKVYKMDVINIFRQQKESFQPTSAKEHGRPILGPEAMSRWQRGVERAALNSHRNLARNIAGISFGPHPGSKPPASRFSSPVRAQSADRSVSSIRKGRSSSFSSFGDLRGRGSDILLSSSLNIPSTDSYEGRNYFIRASVDNSALYNVQNGRRQDEDEEPMVMRPDISLEDLAAGLTLGSDWEERIKSKSSFGAQPRADEESSRPHRTMNIADIEEYAFSQRLPREPRLSKRTETLKNSEHSLSHPSLENSDRKPIKHAPPDNSEGIVVDYDNEEGHGSNQLEQPELHKEQPTSDDETLQPKTSEIANLLSLLREGSAKNNTTSTDVVMEPSDSFIKNASKEQPEQLPVRREVPSPDKTEKDQANEYLLWLERQVEEAVDANQGAYEPVDTIENLQAEEIAEKGVVGDGAVERVSDEQTPFEAGNEDEMLTKAVQLLHTDIYSSVQYQTDTIESPVKSPSTRSFTDPATPVAGSPDKAASGSEVQYPPMPSPMPAVKHPRDLAMKAQQQTPTTDWNPLTRILEREDNSADIYPRYHA